MRSVIYKTISMKLIGFLKFTYDNNFNNACVSVQSDTEGESELDIDPHPPLPENQPPTPSFTGQPLFINTSQTDPASLSNPAPQSDPAPTNVSPHATLSDCVTIAAEL